MKLFSLPARTDRLTTTGPSCADELTMYVPASPTTATFPDDSAMTSSSRIIASASRRSSSETASMYSDSLEGDSTTNSRRVCVATSRDDSDASGPQATDTKCRNAGLSTDCTSRGTKNNKTHRPYIDTTFTMGNR